VLQADLTLLLLRQFLTDELLVANCKTDALSLPERAKCGPIELLASQWTKCGIKALLTEHSNFILIEIQAAVAQD